MADANINTTTNSLFWHSQWCHWRTVGFFIIEIVHLDFVVVLQLECVVIHDNLLQKAVFLGNYVGI